MVDRWHSVRRNGGTVRVESLFMCDRSQGVYFPPNHRRRTIVFRVLFQQTNKLTRIVGALVTWAIYTQGQLLL